MQHYTSSYRIKSLEAEIVRLKGILNDSTFQHPSDAEIESLARRMTHNPSGESFLFQSTANLIDFCREILSGEPHIDGYPIMSVLPNAPISVRNRGDAHD